MWSCRRAARALAALIAGACLCACGQSQSGLYDRAIKSFANGEYAEAAEGFERAGGYADAATYAAYSRGLTLVEQGRCAEAAPYFEQARGFMYGDQRWAYCSGCALIEAGAFDEAAAAFASIEDFEDAAQWRAYSEARAAENAQRYEDALGGYEAAGGVSDAPDRLDDLRKQVYAYAGQLMDEGRYEMALNMYGKLGDYRESEAKARECKRVFREALYQQAETLLAAGDTRGAYEIFLGLSGYNDAQTRADELGATLGVQPEDGSD